MAWLKLIVFGTATFGLYFWRRFVAGKMCRSARLLKGKTAIVTGANCGLGKATACELAKRGARVIFACRDANKGQAAVNEICRQTSEGQLVVKTLDLASLQSVREFVEGIYQEEDRVDILVNNAGVYQCPYGTTEDGFELQMGVNHLGHFLLTNLLLESIKRSPYSRIVIVSSILMKRGKIDVANINRDKGTYNKRQAYADSKLANALFSRELSRRLGNTNVGVYCVSPGIVFTSLGRHVMSPILSFILSPLARLLLKTPYQGCQTVLHCCVAEELDKSSGNFFRNCESVQWPEVVDDIKAKQLWDVSEKLVGLTPSCSQ